MNKIEYQIPEGYEARIEGNKVVLEPKESEDERIRKAIVEFFELQDDNTTYSFIPKKNILTWLEKQSEQNLIDKVEPKFKVGDWVVFNNKHQSIYQVEKIEDGYYILRHTHGGTFRVCVLHDESLRLWTIQDAKDGDMLAAIDSVLIFKYIDKTGLSLCKSYCEVIGNSGLGLGFEFPIKDIHPATKEQRETLLKAMHEASYKWDSEKKELRKIEQNPWKPSDGQIKALEDSIEFLGCTKKVRENLKSLYEQLKKLRG